MADVETAIDKEPSAPRPIPSTAYSVFSKTQKRWIVFIIAFAGMFSPLSSFIYYPAIHALATDLHTSIGAINLSITTYMIVSGITPSLLGDAADQVGRRPIYNFAFAVYLAANIGLALQRSYPALLVLRMIQSIGSSGTNDLRHWCCILNYVYRDHRNCIRRCR
jgi:MFS family permease